MNVACAKISNKNARIVKFPCLIREKNVKIIKSNFQFDVDQVL